MEFGFERSIVSWKPKKQKTENNIMDLIETISGVFIQKEKQQIMYIHVGYSCGQAHQGSISR